jgi:phosphatidylserine decarboxylase precursor
MSYSPNDILKKDKDFNQWINDFVVSRGNFLDTPESTGTLETFINNPEYKIHDYIKGPSGWFTYNQFLARQLKPGKRPVAERCNNDIIVSPADSEFKGQWSIAQDAIISIKNTNYSVADLLGESRYKYNFKNGIFTHSFLSIADYHRYHTPVGGTILETKVISATTWVTETKKPDGSLENTDNVGFQFQHTRGYIIIESTIGMVAVIPVGMGHISSVIITVEEGTALAKGDEFGYFAFGGSDIVMLFEESNIEFIAKENTHYKQGEQIARKV